MDPGLSCLIFMKEMALNIYIGFDEAETTAYNTLSQTLIEKI